MKWALLVVVLLVSEAAHAQHDNHAEHQSSGASKNAQIIVTINPEIRVSAIVSASMLPHPKCGEAIELKVLIVNHGFVTAPLRAAIVDDKSGRVAVHMATAKLSGRLEDQRLLHLVPLSSGETDITVAFRIDNNEGSHGGRDRVHLLVRCVP